MRNTAESLTHPRMSDPSVLSHIAERLKRQLGAEAVIVYGSVARGDAHDDSDIDLLVIAPSEGDRFHRIEWVRRTIDDPGLRPLISPLVLTPDEVRRRLEADDRFVRQIIERGVELGGDGQDARRKWGGITPMSGARASDRWRGNARRDWRRVELHLSAEDGSAAGFFLQQAVEKFLKGWLLDRGWELRKTHRVDDLLSTAVGYQADLAPFRPLCERVKDYYFADRYPDEDGSLPAPPRTEQVGRDLDETRRLILALFPDEQLA